MPKGWHKEDIKAAIRKQGVTLLDVDRANGLPDGTCYNALNRPNFGAELAMAEFLGRSPRELWPSRYELDGTYRHPKSQAHHSLRQSGGERQNGAAA